MQSIIHKIKAEGGYQVLLDKIASGRALQRIALDDYQCSRHTLYKILHRHPKLWDLFLMARKESAMALAELASEIADDLTRGGKLPTREDIGAAKLQVEQRMRMAAAYDRETFGLQQPVAGQVLSVGSLYLQVLQAAAAPKQLPASGPAALPVKDAEVVEESPTP